MGNNEEHALVMSVGIDLSMNATGLSVVISKNNSNIVKNYTASNPEPEPLTAEEQAKLAKRKRKPKEKFVFKSKEIVNEKFYLIVPKEPKSAKKFSATVEVVSYNREYDDTDNYALTDMAKIHSAQKLASTIKKLVKYNLNKYNLQKCEVKIEGSLMASSFSKRTSRLNDLTAFNSIVKLMLLSSPEFSRIGIVAPRSLKQLATGSGAAKKEQMIEQFAELKAGSGFDIKGKIDDVVDAWFLASCIIDDADYYTK